MQQYKFLPSHLLTEVQGRGNKNVALQEKVSNASTYCKLKFFTMLINCWNGNLQLKKFVFKGDRARDYAYQA
jgi:hypothetical protein